MENATITMDKGIYKPGEEINYRVLLTSVKTDKPIEKNVNLNIYDGNSNRVYSKEVKSSDFGIITGNFKLADELNSGTYKIEVESDNIKKSKEFKVNPYTIDKFETKVITDKEQYNLNEKMKLNTENTYFYGEPVKNAETVINIKKPDGTIKEEKQETDITGKTTFEYSLEQLGKYEINIVTTDESNYVTEENKIIYVKKDAFEIELIPETKELVNGDNTIYVFTKTIDGKPIKSYINVKSGNIKKQVATDENGIGLFNINITSREAKLAFDIEAKNEAGETVKTKKALDIEYNKTIILTDKAKYNIGEDINVFIKNATSKNNNIIIYKNKELVKTVSIENADETKINLGETSGIIDVVLLRESQIESKRTIFIKPDKNLNITLKTDKEEYKPGEKINLQIDTDKEEDTAVLVSVLDEAVQKLSNNDLNIDNIKLALSNIKFTNEIDAASLYTNIVDDKSEQAIMGILLKQENDNYGFSQETKTNYKQKQQAEYKIKCIIILALIVTFVILCIKKKKFRKIVMDIINVITIWSGITTILIGIASLIDAEELSIVLTILGLIVAGYIYRYLFTEYRTKIFKSIISSMIILIGIIYLQYYLLENIMFDFSIIVKLFIGIMLIIAIGIIVSNNMKEKHRKMVNGIIKTVVIAIIAYIITTFLTIFLGIDNTVNINLYVLLNVIMNIITVEKIKQFKKKSNYKKVLETGKNVIVALAILIILVFMINSIRDNRKTYPTPDDNNDNNGFYEYDFMNPDSVKANDNTETASKSPQTINGGFKDIVDFAEVFGERENREDTVENTNKVDENKSEEIKKNETTESNIRNVFLESMCFIPDKIAEKGNTNIEIQSSDNITTWDIQVIGNNKNGDIGYASKNIKVFKDFFLDYELPNNLKVGDKISVPVTINNYTESSLNANIKIQQSDWFKADKIEFNLLVDSKSNKMEYITIEILKAGNNKLRMEAVGNNYTDIIEKQIEIEPNGYKVSKAVSSGVIDKKETQDVIFDENVLEGTTRKTKVKIYSSPEIQAVAGMENMLKMPTGCFEQVSSSLYPDIMILKYLKNTKTSNPEIEQKALKYIQTGYQKLLAYEVKGTKGGYSLYGKAPASERLTSYGLMQMKEMSSIYNVDENVMNDMKTFILSKQKSDGSFGNIRDTAYIVWNTLQAYPEDKKLDRAIEYLKKNYESKVNDNYTLAIISNCLADKYPKDAKKIIDKVMGNKSENYDRYTNMYGTRGNYLSVETKAILSIAMSKLNYKTNENKQLMDELIKQRDAKGNWYNTQTTAMMLKALNTLNNKQKLKDNKITIIMNGQEEVIDVSKEGLNIIQKEYDNLEKENKLEIISANGEINYEIINEYYIPYENVKNLNSGIEVKTEFSGEMSVTKEVNQNIKITNTSKNDIENGQIKIQIPQGFKVDENQLEKLKLDGIIEKYEMNYRELLIYIKELERSGYKEFQVNYRAQYPIEVKSGEVEVYDYYNPDIKGISLPQAIKIN